MDRKHYLIVDQVSQTPENFPELLKQLSEKHGLDIYQSRQRIIGRGLSLLTQGSGNQLEKIAATLAPTGLNYWLVEPTPPTFAPQRLRALQLSTGKITFSCQKSRLDLVQGMRVIAILAELSGSLADKSVKQLLSSHAYRGIDNIRHLDDDKIRQTILQGKPVLDLYLLDKNQRINAGVRVFPGKFDPKGLGDLATLSSRQNLERILQLARDHAGDFHLFMDFGLANLPGCMLRKDDADNPETLRRNLISLTHYGWLMADLVRAETRKPAQEHLEQEPAAIIGAALAAMHPSLAAEDINQVATVPATEIDDHKKTPSDQQQSTFNNSASGLPTPPQTRSGAKWRKPGYWLGTGGAVAAGIIMTLVEAGNSQTLNILARQAFATGTLPLIIALLLFWYGFYFLRLKRQVENTPTSRVRSIAMGMVEVKGRAIRQYALLSPMSHTPCVFYRLTKYRRREKNNQWDVSSISNSDNVPFLLEDETGRVEIDPLGCRVSAGTRNEGTPGRIGLFDSNNDSNDKWVEDIVVEGTLLYVLGYASVKRDRGPTLTEKKIEALRELKQNPHKLQKFDRDGDGRISQDEWDEARTATEQEILRQSLAENARKKKQEEHITIGKKTGRPLVISETPSEEHLTSRLLFFSIALLIGSAVATAAAIYFFVDFIN